MRGRQLRMAGIMLAPALAIMILIIGWPLLFSLYLGFQRVEFEAGRPAYHWIGLGNYTALLVDNKFYYALRQTLIYTIVRVGLVIVLSLGLALILDRVLTGRATLGFVFLVPWTLSSVANALMWGWIANGSYGVLNGVLVRLGIIDHYIVWLSSPFWAMSIVVGATVWKALPFPTLMLWAGLQAIPMELEDAAKVDGANAWQRLWAVIMPGLRPIILVLLILESVWGFKIFDLIWVMTEGGPIDRTLVLNVLAYREGFKFMKLGYATALTYIMTFIIVIMSMLYFRILEGGNE